MNDNLCDIERSAFSARVEHEKLLMRAEAAEQERDRYKREVMVYEEVIAALRKRAEAAEAEVARLKALLEAKQPAQPYTPRVGDVATPAPGAAHAGAEFVIKSFDERSGFYRMGWIKADEGGTKHSMDDASSMGVLPLRYLRRATASERAAAGLPPEPAEAPAKPEVLPEHLAWIEAHAASWGGEGGSMARADKAASALLAAVARRDGALNAAAAKEVM